MSWFKIYSLGIHWLKLQVARVEFHWDSFQMTTFDPGIFQAALLRVAEATEAAVAVAKSAAAPPPPPAASSSTTKPAVDWSKLVNRYESELRSLRT